MEIILMANDKSAKTKAVNQAMMTGLVSLMKEGICTSENFKSSPNLIDKLSKLDPDQIKMIVDQSAVSMFVPRGPHDKTVEVFFEDLVYFCEQGNEKEVDELLDKLLKDSVGVDKKTDSSKE